MAGHFAAIGFDFQDQESFRTGIGGIGGEAVEVARSPRAVHLQWLDGSGACVAFHLDARSGDLACVTPFFAPEAPTRWRAQSTAPLDDPGCAHCGGAVCDLLDETGELVTRAAVQWLCFQPYRDWLRGGRRYDLEVVGFARSVEAFSDAEAFASSPASSLTDLAGAEAAAVHMAPDAFIPVGILGPNRAVSLAATARFAGRIRAAARLDNARSGGRFWRVRVDALPGAIDVVAAEHAVLGEPRAGGHALVDAWLVGRPVEAPPPPRRSLLRRLLARVRA
jgi:hypothetical protein